MIYDNEDILEDDYPMYFGYTYVVDGEPTECTIGEDDDYDFDDEPSCGDPLTVAEYKRLSGCKEVRRCNIAARGML